MQQEQWRKPVLAAGRPIRDAREAIWFMDHVWPHHKTLAFAKAHQACLAALDGRKGTDQARASFEDAVDQAQLH